MNDGATLLYRASKADCEPARSSRVAVRNAGRKVPRSIYEGARDMARATSPSPRKVASRGGSARRSRCCSRTSSASSLDRLRLRGPNGARDEFLLAATAQNLRKLAKLIPMPLPKPA